MDKQLTAQDFALILGRPIMTPDGKRRLKEVKISGHQLVTQDTETNRKGLYYVEECQPIVKMMYQITVEDVQKRRSIGGSPEQRVIWALRNGYDILGWIDDGLAITGDKDE